MNTRNAQLVDSSIMLCWPLLLITGNAVLKLDDKLKARFALEVFALIFVTVTFSSVQGFGLWLSIAAPVVFTVWALHWRRKASLFLA